MAKKPDWRILAVVALLVIGLAYAGSLFSVSGTTLFTGTDIVGSDCSGIFVSGEKSEFTTEEILAVLFKSSMVDSSADVYLIWEREESPNVFVKVWDDIKFSIVSPPSNSYYNCWQGNTRFDLKSISGTKILDGKNRLRIIYQGNVIAEKYVYIRQIKQVTFWVFARDSENGMRINGAEYTFDNEKKNPADDGVPFTTFVGKQGTLFVKASGYNSFSNFITVFDNQQSIFAKLDRIIINENVNIVVRINDSLGTPADGATVNINGQIKTVSGGLASYVFSRGAVLNINIAKEGYKVITDSLTVSDASNNPFANQKTYRLIKNIIMPPNPPIPIWESVWNQIADFFAELFKNIRFFSVTGQQTVAPNSVNQYVISLPAPSPIDSDWSDGKYQFRYANWGFTDRNGAIKQQGTWESVNNSYEKTVSITAPSSPADYAIIATIYEYNYVFDSASNVWKITSEGVIAKEGINVGTRVTISPNPPPVMPDFGKIISDAINGFFSWLAGLFK